MVWAGASRGQRRGRQVRFSGRAGGAGRGRTGIVSGRASERRRFRGTRGLVVAVCGALAWGAFVCSAPALALAQRGHVFGFTFGGPGDAAGQFRFEGPFERSEPAGIAVDEATEDVYVVDRGNHRLQEFGPRGEFVAAWGLGVNTGGEAKYEVCVEDCQGGLTGTGPGAFDEASAVAVDNSAGGQGTVYVGIDGSAKKPRVRMFPADGEKPMSLLPVEEDGRLEGIATDRTGQVWIARGEEERESVYEEGALEGFSDAAKSELLGEVYLPVECPRAALAVDGAGETFYFDHELLIEAEPFGEREEVCPQALERLEEEFGAHAAEGQDRRPVLAAAIDREGRLSLEGIDRLDTTGVAVDQASGEGTPLGAAANGDVYVANDESISVFNAAGAPVQSFGSGDLTQTGGIAVNSRNGYVYAVNPATDEVNVFVPESGGEPSVGGLAAEHVHAGEAEVSAQLNPHGEDTRYYFQYGTSSCAAGGGCTQAPEQPGGEVPAGYGEQRVSVELTGLQPGTTYYYRVLASNARGQAEGERAFATLTTLSSPSAMLDGREWEQVSPAEKDGSGVEPIAREGGLIQSSSNGEAVTYVANGPIEGEPVGNRAPEPTQVLSTRSPSGWSSQELVTPHEQGEGVEIGEAAEYRFSSSDLALSLLQPSIRKTQPLEVPPLAPGASEKTMYVRADRPVEPQGAGSGEDVAEGPGEDRSEATGEAVAEGSGQSAIEGPGEDAAYARAAANSGYLAPGYLPLVTPSTVGVKAGFGGHLEFIDATPDLSDVLFESEGVAVLQGGAPGLYEWQADGGLQLASVLPDGLPAFEPSLGYEGVDVRNAIVSADGGNGARVVFSGEGEGAPGEGNEQPGLYLRDTYKGQTIQLNAAQGVAEPQGEDEAGEFAFQGASADESRVFFTDTEPLTEESGQRPEQYSEENPADLYECEITETAGQLGCDLKDLTATTAPGSGEVLNVLPGISQDGSYVYFVANGALTPDAQRGDCEHRDVPLAEQGCNLYVWHEGQLALITRLSGEDSGDWGSLIGRGEGAELIAPRPDLADVSAGASSDGEYFAFMSKLSPTEYDNTDAGTQNAHDEEVYLYHARTHLLVCASCNSRGPSVGVYDTEHSGEGRGLLVDRRSDWEGQYLAGSIPGWIPIGLDGALHQPRYLSNSGRLFFDSPDELVPDASNGKEDVYEYEPGGTGTCTLQAGCIGLVSSGSSEQESAFVEASENGDDAFFVTALPLVSSDHDSNYDLYDARACTEASPCLKGEEVSQQPCETASACNTTPAQGAAALVAPASMTTLSSGNVAQQQAAASTSKKIAPRPLTRAQRLARALESCHRRKQRHRRTACERRARRQYAPHKHTDRKTDKKTKRAASAPGGRGVG